MRKCVVIPDSFKGSMRAGVFCRVARDRLERWFPECEVVTIPVADGGEGTVDFYTSLPGWRAERLETEGTRGERVEVTVARKGDEAVAEAASCAGWGHWGARPDPSQCSTAGLGRVLERLSAEGVRVLWVGLGGTCSHDAGCGMAAALGVRFWRAGGGEFVPVGATLGEVAGFDVTAARARLAGCRLEALCDVRNPMCGPLGAARIYAPQKGADSAMVERLEAGTVRLAEVIQRETGRNVAELSGAGAAGGAGGGMVAFLGAELRRGIDVVLAAADFEARLAGADWVMTGEGCFDGQSVQGKAVGEIVARAARAGVKVAVFAGRVECEAAAARAWGVTELRCLHSEGKTADLSEEAAARDLARVLDEFLCGR